MNRSSESTLLIEELAAHWTEPTLEILKDAGWQRPLSADTELWTWRTLMTVLRRQASLRAAPQLSLTVLRERVLRETALRLAREYQPDVLAVALAARVERLAGDRRATAAERRLHAQLVGQLAFQLPNPSAAMLQRHVSTGVG